MKRNILIPLALLTISLAVVVILALYVRTFEKQAASMRGQVPPTPTEPTLTVLGEHFFDTIDGFRFKVPAQGWQIRVLSRPDSLPAEVPTRPILSNMVPIAVVSRDANGDTVAKVTVAYSDKRCRAMPLTVLFRPLASSSLSMSAEPRGSGWSKK